MLASCAPASPSAGRPGPVRKVAILGDSLTFGFFGWSPSVWDSLAPQLYIRRVALTLDGGPGETPLAPFVKPTTWRERLSARIESDDPDVVIIQAVLFPGGVSDAAARQAYLDEFTRLLDVAQSRGAHVYVVTNLGPDHEPEGSEAEVARTIQERAIVGRGISTIPADWYLERCAGRAIGDGWHYSAAGQACYASALLVAIDQLRGAIG